MPSPLAHTVVAVAIGAVFPRHAVPRRLWLVGAVCAMAPDVDAVSSLFGMAEDALWGHRGISHGFLAAVVVGFLGMLAVRRQSGWITRRGTAWAYLTLCCASHGLLDAFTYGGDGIAFFAPFSEQRLFLPWHPIAAKQLKGLELLGEPALERLAIEMCWIELPALLLLLGLLVISRLRARRAGRSA